MVRRRVRWSDVVFALLLMIAPPAAAFHYSGGRYGNAIMAAAAFIAGVAVLVWSLGQPEVTQAEPAAVVVRAPRPSRPQPERNASGRLTGWLPAAVLSGALASAFVTAVLAVVYSYIVAMGSATSAGSAVSDWSAGLYRYVMGHRTPADLALALGLQLALGIGWATVYSVIVEPRLSGPGWRRGLLFAVVPWLGGMLVVLPLLGAGVLGLSISAGPVPALGALLASLLYGPALGGLYSREDVLTETGELEDEGEGPAMARSEVLMVAALLPGLVLGGVASLLASSIVAPGQDMWIATVVGAAFGGALAVLLASFLGLRASRTP